ncbi:MAG: family 20 glycosylhydrolase, partial [Flavobacteriales bacterium]|nr:family 20 glycosylhydrolase [Flavobacteriales bacterium]
MRPALVFAYLCSSVLLGAQPLMPWPAGYAAMDGRLGVQAPIHVSWSGFHDDRLHAAERRWLTRMGDITGLTLFEPDSLPGTTIAVAVDRKGDHLQVGEDESYALAIAEGGIRIRATTDLGALHAFATLYQLLQRDEQGWYFPHVAINDSPRFPWRGLLLDVCRHFMPREVVLRELDGLELVKMNVLHLHLTEDQGFRIESKLFPELHEQGSEGQYLSQEDIRVILREADLRGIRVIPEFDLPGHATSWFVSHPEL